jgi:hypothetical protein
VGGWVIEWGEGGGRPKAAFAGNDDALQRAQFEVSARGKRERDAWAGERGSCG